VVFRSIAHSDLSSRAGFGFAPPYSFSSGSDRHCKRLVSKRPKSALPTSDCDFGSRHCGRSRFMQTTGTTFWPALRGGNESSKDWIASDESLPRHIQLRASFPSGCGTGSQRHTFRHGIGARNGIGHDHRHPNQATPRIIVRALSGS